MTVTGSAAFEDKNVGTDKTVNYTSVALSGEEAGNYTIADTTTGLGTINQKEAQVTFNPTTKVYDGTTDATPGAATIFGLINADEGNVGVTADAAYEDKNVGTGKRVAYTNIALTGTETQNYRLTQTSVDADTGTITRKSITATFADISKTYDGSTTATAGAGTLVGVEDIDNGKVSVTANAAYADKNAGTGKTVNYTGVALSGEEAGNYTIANTATGQGAIAAKSITATFADISKTYDGTNTATAGAGTLNGVEAVDTGKVSVMASAAYADKNAGTDKQVDYSNVTLTGTEAGNYTIANTATGNGQINRANLTVSVQDYSREYDGTTSASGAELQVTSGTLYAGDTISGGTKVFDTKDVGTGKTITVSGVSINDGNNGDNYAVTYQPNTNSVITALPQPEPVNPQPSNPEPSKPEPVNPQPGNPEPSKPEPVNPQPSNPEPSKPEPVNPQPSNPEPSKPELVNPQPSNPEPSKPEPVNPQPSNPEPSNPEPVNPQPSNPEPVNTDSSQEQQWAETGNTVADIEAATEKLGAEEVNEMKEKMAAQKHEALEVTDEKSGDDENEKKQSKK